jgi:hypothetical protein
VGARSSLVTILSNYACDVGQRGDGRMVFNCGGGVVTAALALGAVVCLSSMMGFALLVAVGGSSAKAAFGVASGAALAAALGTLAIQRYGRHGRFEIDGERAVMRRFRGSTMLGEYSFRDLLRVWLVVDALDGMSAVQDTTPPSWLQVATRTGEVFRIAKGTRQELAPVCAALRRLGLAFDAPRLD